MSQQSPRFNEIFVQQNHKPSNEFKLDLEKGYYLENEGLPEEFDRKLIGFQSIDELFASLQRPYDKQSSATPPKEPLLPESSSIKVTNQQNLKNQTSRLPHITIHYNQPSLPANSNTVPRSQPRWIEKVPYRKKVIQYEERLVRVPVEKEAIGYYEVEHLTNATNTKEVPQQSRSPKKLIPSRNPSLLAAKIHISPVSDVGRPQLLQKNKSEAYFPNTGVVSPVKPSEIQQHLSFKRVPTILKIGNGQSQVFSSPVMKRYITSDHYDFRQRQQELQKISSKVILLKQSELKLFIKNS